MNKNNSSDDYSFGIEYSGLDLTQLATKVF